MAAVRSLLSAIGMAALASIISGCHLLSSMPFDIAPGDRATPTDLEGEYWVVPASRDGVPYFTRVILGRDELRRYTTHYPDEQNNSATGKELATLLETAHDGVFVVVSEFSSRKDGHGEEDVAQFEYDLLLRGRLGTWIYVRELGHADSLFDNTRLAHLAAIAARYGVVVPTDEPALELRSAVNAEVVRKLFTDPEFLSGLEIAPFNVYQLLPRSAPPNPNETLQDEAPESPQGPLTSPRFALDARSLLQPAELVGDFTVSGRADCNMRMRVVAREDGRLVFHLKDPVPGRHGDEFMVLGLLPGVDPDTYIGLVEQWSPNPNGRDEWFSYVLVQYIRHWKAVMITDMVTADLDLAPAFTRIVRGVRQQAAARHGLRYEHGKLQGALDPTSIQALFADPRFHLGLDTDSDSELRLWREARE